MDQDTLPPFPEPLSPAGKHELPYPTFKVSTVDTITVYYDASVRALLPFTENVIADARAAYEEQNVAKRAAWEASWAKWGETLFKIRDAVTLPQNGFFLQMPEGDLLYKETRLVNIALLLALLAPPSDASILKPETLRADPERARVAVRVLAQVRECYLLLCAGRPAQELMFEGEQALAEICAALAMLSRMIWASSVGSNAVRLMFNHSPFRHPRLIAEPCAVFPSPAPFEKIWKRWAMDRIPQVMATAANVETASAALDEMRKKVLYDVFKFILPPSKGALDAPLLPSVGHTAAAPSNAAPVALATMNANLSVPALAPAATKAPSGPSNGAVVAQSGASTTSVKKTVSSSIRAMNAGVKTSNPLTKAADTNGKATAAHKGPSPPTVTHPAPSPSARAAAVVLVPETQYIPPGGAVDEEEEELPDVADAAKLPVAPATAVDKAPGPSPARSGKGPASGEAATGRKQISAGFVFNAPQRDAVRLEFNESMAMDIDDVPINHDTDAEEEVEEPQPETRPKARMQLAKKPAQAVKKPDTKGKGRAIAPKPGQNKRKARSATIEIPDSTEEEEEETQDEIVVVVPRKSAKGQKRAREESSSPPPRPTKRSAMDVGGAPAPTPSRPSGYSRPSTSSAARSSQSGPAPARTPGGGISTRPTSQSNPSGSQTRPSGSQPRLSGSQPKPSGSQPRPSGSQPKPSGSQPKAAPEPREFFDTHEEDEEMEETDEEEEEDRKVVLMELAAEEEEEEKEEVEEEEEEDDVDQLGSSPASGRRGNGARAKGRPIKALPKPSTKPAPRRPVASRAKSPEVKQERKMKSTTNRYATGGNEFGRQKWTNGEVAALEKGLKAIREEGVDTQQRWLQILEWYGGEGTRGRTLAGRNVGQLKDKGRNLKIAYERRGSVPPWLDF